jgi:hypothetical protein
VSLRLSLPPLLESMNAAAQISLPVSLGEALDKLTILDIKLAKIQDEKRRTDVQAEYDALMTPLKPYIDAYPYHYRILRTVNLAIWETQDKFHGKDTTPEQGAILCRQILTDNDRRFRVKAKLNALANSALREQKGYAAKKAIVYTHLGLGDHFWMNGAVRYLATCYDETLVVCKDRNKENVRAMFSDDSTIKFLVVQDDADLHPWHLMRQRLRDGGYDVFGCGFFSERGGGAAIYDLPHSFYDDLQLPREVRTEYFHVPRSDASKELRAKFLGRPYIVVHQQSSVKTLLISDQLRSLGEARLMLDINQNLYNPQTHPEEFALAQHAVGKPLLDYVDLLEGAEELHLIESSLYCLASHLDLSKPTRRVCYEPWGGNAERLGVFTTGTASAAAVPA